MLLSVTYLSEGGIVKNFAFTLAEVLITLGIIGVVAALTIPGLMTAYKAHQMRVGFLKAYSTVQQAFKQMEADDVSLDPASYPSGAKTSFYLTFKNYLQAPLDCGSAYSAIKDYPCYKYNNPDRYYMNYNNSEKVQWSLFDGGQLLLQDGTLLLFNADGYGWLVSVDINGFKSKPNRYGYDLFTFQFKEGELRTMGDLGTTYTNMEVYCSNKSNNVLNGIACAKRAKTDSDYFKVLIRNSK